MTAAATQRVTRLGEAMRIPAVRLGRDDVATRLRVRALLAEELRAGSFEPACDAWLAGWDEDFTARLAANGLVGMTIPQEYGGAGARMLTRHVVLEELLAVGAPVAAHWVADRQIVPSLLRYGSELAKRDYLPEIAAGRCFMAAAMSEPDAGSDLTALRTRAVSVPGGWHVSGTKVWTSGAHHAHAIVVLARTPELDGEDRRSYTQFIVEAGSPGLEIRPVLTLDGVHHFNEVMLEDVRVPDDLVLGRPGDGWSQIRAELSYERGGPERFLSLFPLLRALIDAVRESLATDPYVADQVGTLIARLAVLRRMSIGLADSVDRTGSASAAVAAMVKDLGTAFETDVVDVARRLVHDPRYVMGDGPLRRLLAQATQRLPAFGIRAGSTEMLRGLIAREVGLR